MNTVPAVWSRRIGATLALAAMVSLLYFLVPSTAAACGSIVGSEDEWLSGVSFSALPISDCTNPFGVTDTEVRGRLLVQGSEVSDGGSVVVSAEGTSDIRFEYRPSGDELYNIATWQLFRRDSDDYRYTPVFSRSLSLAEYREAAVAFLPVGTDVDRFITAYEQNDTTEFDDDPDLLVLYEDLLNYFDTLPKIQPNRVMAGSYVLVIRESYLTFSRRNPVWEFFVPTAHAQVILPERVTTLQFTLVEDTPPPTGASSVLFLPGIQSSRLYKEGLLFEDQVWPPNALLNNDIRDLAMTESGFSVNEIYTRDVIDTSAGIGSVYGGFLDFLETQKTAPLPIKEYLAFAYDWRFDVNDIVLSGTQYQTELKAVIDELEDLAEESHTGKVTVIAHSNGGLLAKAMLRELEFRNQEALVDKVVFIGVPHLGTPKAIGTLLHGYDQTDKLGGVVIDAKSVREVINNMPGVYALLPSEEYFNSVTGPVVTFESGTATDVYRLRYGEQLDSLSEYREFMYGEDGFERGLEEEVWVPSKVNRPLFDEALRRHAEIYDNWTAPDSIEVFEIVGVGLPTMISATYRTITEKRCAVVGGGQVLCVDESQIKPFANLSRSGDATVVERSALGYTGDKQDYYLNLPELNSQRRLDGDDRVEHYNLPEAKQLQDLIRQLLATSTVSTVNFITDSLPVVADEFTVEVIDSPIRPLATDTSGRQTGVVIVNGQRVIKEEIPGSYYFEFGGSKYLVMPKGLPRQTRLFGEEFGGYTLSVYDLDSNDRKTVRSVLSNATVTPTMVVQYQVTVEGYSVLETDYNGDGEFETKTDMSGRSLTPERVSYQDVILAIKAAHLGKARESSVIILLNSAKRVSESKLPPKLRTVAEQKLLLAVIQLLKQYERRGVISNNTLDELVTIINKL